MNVDPVRSERLELVWLSPQLIEALLDGRSDEAARIGGFAIPPGFPDDHDRGFLKEGGVFTDTVIDAYIGLKMQEVTRLRMSTHPVEFELYYSV